MRHVARPKVAARILISSSLLDGYDDLKTLSSRFASRCLVNDDGEHAASKSIAFRQKSFVFRYRSPEHFMEVFRAFYGPVHNAFLAVDAEQQATLEAVILSLIAERNTATDGSMRLPAEYAEIVMVKA